MSRELLIFIVLCCLPCALSAQRPQAYTGPYRVGDYRGSATFTYSSEGRDTLLDGPFEMEGADLEGFFSGGDTHFSFNGLMEAGMPNGGWELTFGEYLPTGTAEFVNYQYRLDVDGTRHRAIGKVSQGKLDSVWVQEIQRIKQSEPAELLLRSEVTLVEGIPQQSFRIEGTDAALLGRLTREGLAHDVWTVYTDLRATENWYFREGRLEKIEFLDEDGGQQTIGFFNEAATTLVPLDADYLSLLNAYSRLVDGGQEAALANSPATELLATHAQNYARVVEVLTALGAEQPTAYFRVKVPTYPLSRSELQQLADLRAGLERADTLANELLKSGSLAIIDAERGSLRERLSRITGPSLAPVRRIIQDAQDVLPYVPRERYLESLPEGSRSFAELAALTERALTDIDSVRQDLGERLNTEERQQVVAALEEQVAREYRFLDSLISAQPRKTRQRYHMANIRQAARRELDDYRALTDVVARRARASELLTCLERMEALVLTLAAQPDREEEILDLYTDEVWNNFTATVMEERIKRRLTEAYADVLLPYLRDQLGEPLDCQRTDLLYTQLTTLNARMRKLREEDTDDLEDEIKDADDDPRRLLQLLNTPLAQ